MVAPGGRKHFGSREYPQTSVGGHASGRLGLHISGRARREPSAEPLFRTSKYTVHFNGSTLALKHYAPAHTDSDISVHFTEADVLHTGDTFWNREYPFIDYSTGGSIDGQIRAAEANLAKASATTVVIPGHGAVGGKADLTLFRDVLIEAREKVARLKKQGRTVEEVISAKPTAPYDAEWGQGFQSPKSFLGWVYQGV